MSDEQLRTHTYDYQAPVIPAYTAAGLFYSFYWMVPFWITEFIIHCVKGRAFEDGVSDADWVVLFFWLVFEIGQNFCAITSIKKAECVLCNPFWLYLLFAILGIFFTVYMLAIGNTVLFIEMVTCIITVIIQCVLFIGTIISFIISSRSPRINPGEYQ